MKILFHKLNNRDWLLNSLIIVILFYQLGYKCFEHKKQGYEKINSNFSEPLSWNIPIFLDLKNCLSKQQLFILILLKLYSFEDTLFNLIPEKLNKIRDLIHSMEWIT